MTVFRCSVLPKFCNRCKRHFWLERYEIRYIEVGIEHRSIPVCVCKKCLDKERERNESKVREG